MNSGLIPFNEDSALKLEEHISLTLPKLQLQLNEIAQIPYKAFKSLNVQEKLVLDQYKTDAAALEAQYEQTISSLESDFDPNSFFAAFLGTHADLFEAQKKAAFKSTMQYGAISFTGLVLAAIGLGIEYTDAALVIGALSLLVGGIALYFFSEYKKNLSIFQSIEVSTYTNFSERDIKLLITKDIALKKGYESLKRTHLTDFEVRKRGAQTTFETEKEALDSVFNQTFEVSKQAKQAKTIEVEDKIRQIVEKMKAQSEYIIRHLNQYPETADFEAFDLAKADKSDKPIPLVFMRVGVVEPEVEGQTGWQFPYFIRFLNENNVLFLCSNLNEVNTAVSVVHHILARTLIAVPTGKLKIVGIDPKRLGKNFKHFLSLHDSIYGGKIWSEPADIQQQLQNLVLNIEHVIQNLLQAQFPNMDAYNRHLKSVKEVSRVLVIFDFPTGFSDESMKTLLKIMENGPKAGVNVVLVIDKTFKMPYGTSLNDFLKVPNTISLDAWDTKNRKYDTRIPMDKVVTWANERLTKAENESLNYEDHLLPEAQWWKGSTANEFKISIGRKRGDEALDFVFDNINQPTALLIGKPGSGKSNLLHVLITNALIHYAPEEIEFHLIDFKGGVEFVAYSEKKIPHIRTIAIESEREFGLSVLEGLEKELLRREKVFRDKKQNKISEFRQNFPDEWMPRVVLMIDEFQELFTYQDTIAEKADTILENIVRKGRSFGINLLLATQSFGHKSISSTIRDLIAVRLAFMCSDQDSRMILADNNPAAQLLTRAGQGIYNAHNGLVEGNKHFQAYFLKRSVQQPILDKISAYSVQKKTEVGSQIVFRGDMMVHIEKNKVVNGFKPVDRPRMIHLYLGASVSIHPDIRLTLAQDSGMNLLIIGSDVKLVMRLLMSSLTSIALQQKPMSLELGLSQFYVMNFLNAELPEHHTIRDFFEDSNYNFEHVTRRNVLNTLTQLEGEVQRRLAEESEQHQPIYLTIVGLQRYSGFSMENYTATAETQLLGYLLKEGPDVGVFVLLHCDSIRNFEQKLERAIQYCRHRVALNMDLNDMGTVLNTTVRTRLDKDKAYWSDISEVTLQKLRLYQLPNKSWFHRKIN